MSAQTSPGQAAYGVMWAVSGIDVPWENLDADDRQLWDDIAQAVINLYREDITPLADERHA